MIRYGFTLTRNYKGYREFVRNGMFFGGSTVSSQRSPMLNKMMIIGVSHFSSGIRQMNKVVNGSKISKVKKRESKSVDVGTTSVEGITVNSTTEPQTATFSDDNTIENNNKSESRIDANPVSEQDLVSAALLHDDSEEYLTTIFDKMEPYIDTYEVYKQLISSGFTPKQSDEVINYLILQINSKVSKLSTKYSQQYELENENYLFESAKEELRVDVTRSREQHINELINLIHNLERDFNILSDELNNDFLQMKNDTQVTTNDQKSENTLHSKKINLRIQETNHKITTELNSAMRSEIESLRWHISRWGIMAILVSVFAGCATFYIYKIKTQRRLQQKNEFLPLVIYEPSEFEEFEEDEYHSD